MNLGELTYAEQVLLASVAFGTVLLTALIVICIIWKRCWIHQLIWKDSKKKNGMDDIICIRYPPDIYPSSVGVFRENIIHRGSPEEEIARIFSSSSPVKRDSTYSSMSENSSASVYELPNSPRHSSATASPLTGTPNSPDSTSHLIHTPTPSPHKHRATVSPNNNNGTQHPVATTLQEEQEKVEDSGNRSGGGVIEAELNDLQAHHPQPFFTFGLKYDQTTGTINIDFLEARNLPWREYLNQPTDPFFTLEIEPRKLSSRKTSLGSSGGYKTEMMRYRFVTKTIKKANDICDFSEKFLAQLSKANLKDYKIRFTGFDSDRFGNPTELGSTTLTFDDFRDFTNHKLILSCSLKEPVIKRGELLLGLCYLPTAERMSVNVMKVTNMNPYFSYGTITKQSICYVRVFLLRADTGKVIKRKKTSYQRLGTCADQPIFNETLVFDMPPSELIQTVLLVMVCLTDKIQSGGGTILGGGDQSPSPPSMLHTSAKRHSTPEHHLRPPEMFESHHIHHQRHSIDDALFHYGDNMNRCSRSSSGVFESSSAGNSRRGSAEPPSPSPTRQSPASASASSTDTASRSKDHVVGKVAFGYSVRNQVTKAHWEKMIRAPRTIASEWHSLK